MPPFWPSVMIYSSCLLWTGCSRFASGVPGSLDHLLPEYGAHYSLALLSM